MTLRFVEPRRPDSEQALPAGERAQLDLMWDRLGFDHDDGDRLTAGATYAGAVERWTVLDEDGVTVVDVWGAGMDLAAFTAGRPVLIGAAVQHRYEGADDDLTAALAQADRVDAPGFLLLGVIDFPIASTAGEPLPVGRLVADWSAHSMSDPLAPATKRDGTPWPLLPATGLPSKARALLQGTGVERRDAIHYLSGALKDAQPALVVAVLDVLFANVTAAVDPRKLLELASMLAPAPVRDAVALYHDDWTVRAQGDESSTIASLLAL